MSRLHKRRPLDPTQPISNYETGKVIIAGGAGFLGQALAQWFERQKWDVVILSRRPSPSWGSVRTVVWDGRTPGPWEEELVGSDAVVNLTGRSVACLYTPENKREIIASRVESTRLIAEARGRCPDPPTVLVQASSLAIYGDPGDRICDEQAPHGTGFSAEVCEAWEKAFFAEQGFGGPRRVALRIGFVLGRDGGALQPLTKLALLYLGGTAGNGRQYISWLHLEDFCAMVAWAITHPEVEGIYNATGPNPATNAEFMRFTRKALGRPWSPPTPAWAVKFGARFLMRVDPSLVLTGRRCVSSRLPAEGFVVKHTNLETTLRELLLPLRSYN